MNFIVAVDENWGIGKNGRLLFNITADMKYFVDKTMGKVVVMGETTLKSLPNSRPLKGRVNIVLTDDPDFTVDGAIVCPGMDALMNELKNHASSEIFVIGGASVYNQLMDKCSKAYVTKVKQSAEADCHINSLDNRPGWKLVETSPLQSDSGYDFTFNVYENDDVK